MGFVSLQIRNYCGDMILLKKFENSIFLSKNALQLWRVKNYTSYALCEKQSE